VVNDEGTAPHSPILFVSLERIGVAVQRVVLFSLFVFSLVNTQPVFGQIHAGLTAGANFASISTDSDLAGYDGRALLALGGVLEIELSDRMSLRFEPMYLQKGAEAHFTTELGEVRHENSLDYLELPILLTYSFAAAETLTPFVTLGPSIGFNLDADFITRLPGGIAGTLVADISDEIELVDLGIVVGVGTKLRTGEGSFFILGRYTWGLTNIFENPHESECCDFPGPVDLNNRGLQILTGYTFPLGSNRIRSR